MRDEDPIGKQRGDQFVQAITMLCIGGVAALAAVIAYAAWTGLVA